MAGDESLVWFCSFLLEVDGFVTFVSTWFPVVVALDVESIEDVDSFVADWDDAVISTSVVLDGVEIDWVWIESAVVVAVCSRTRDSIIDNKKL